MDETEGGAAAERCFQYPRPTWGFQTLCGAVLAGLLVGCGPTDAPLEVLEADPAEVSSRHIAWLADPNHGGRMTSTRACYMAGDYIARQFKELGLESVSDRGDYFQHFTPESLMVPDRACRLSVAGKELVLHKDYSPIARGGSGTFAGSVVFAGYGASSRLRRYDDYSGVDVEGKVVLVLIGEPHSESGQSLWARPGSWTGESDVRKKIRRAAEKGAVAILLALPPSLGEVDILDGVKGDASGPIPAVRISQAVADTLLATAGKRETVDALARHINNTGKPASFEVGGEVAGSIHFADPVARNVIGILPATTGAAGAPVVAIGGHYDHISVWGDKASDKGFGVRPGADDNASGIAALLHVAKALAATPHRNCTYVFAAFSGEELGLLGSEHYCEHAAEPLERTILMANFDQVGMMSKGKLLLLGSVWAPVISDAVAAVDTGELGLSVLKVPFVHGFKWSDHASFAKRDIPTLFFFTGLRHTHHKRTDRVEATNPAGTARVADYAVRILLALDRMQAPRASAKAGVVEVASRLTLDVWKAARLDEILPAGMTAAQMLLRYTLAHTHCHTTIVGTLNVEHLTGNVAAAAKGALPAELYAAITRRVAAARTGSS